MRNGDLGAGPGPRPGGEGAVAVGRGRVDAPTTQVVVTEVSPFHCLYQDALHFHKMSRLSLERSESEASRLARAALLLYIGSAEALIHQAAAELGRPDLAAVIADPARPLPLADVSKLLPGILGAPGPGGDPDMPPWPQFAELLALRASWTHPGVASRRRAYYRSSPRDGFEPLQPHQIPPGVGITADDIQFPRTGLPRDPYALRPRHLDTARSTLDAAIEALDRRVHGAITRDNRHRCEPTRYLGAPGQGPNC